MRRIQWILLSLLISLLIGCSNHDAAQLGSLIGRSIGKPLGTLATAVDETFKTSGDVVKQNPRYQQQVKELAQQPLYPSNDQESYYYKTEVLVKTRGPAQIEALELQSSEDVSDFWR